MANEKLVRIKNRIDTAVNWSVNNPTLAKGEIGLEEETNKIKIGNGSTTWRELKYVKTGMYGTGEDSEIFNDTENVASGDCSHAEGHRTSAEGIMTHAEGHMTIAYGYYSHTEGNNTVTYGINSHAEGYFTRTGIRAFKITAVDITNKKITLDSVDGISVNNIYSIVDNTPDKYRHYRIGKITAIDSSNNIITVDTIDTNMSKVGYYLFLNDGPLSGTEYIFGDNAHAEGYQSFAGGDHSHAEGQNCVANGFSSHAEGESSISEGDHSHAEGGYTIATGDYQHVQGKFNIEDTENKYAHIVGNGTSTSKRSNAHTLDWNGNSWYAGNIKIGGSSYDDTNAKEIATQEYVDNNSGGIDRVYVKTLNSESTDIDIGELGSDEYIEFKFNLTNTYADPIFNYENSKKESRIADVYNTANSGGADYGKFVYDTSTNKLKYEKATSSLNITVIIIVKKCTYAIL